MSAKTKIVVLHSKEILYTGLFLLLGVFFVILLISMFRPRAEETGSGSVLLEETQTLYTPGVYNTNLVLKDQSVNVEVVVDSDHINSIRIVNLEESVAAMYPLLEPTLETLETQILEKQSLDEITYSDNCRYTALVLLDTIRSCIDKAAASGN